MSLAWIVAALLGAGQLDEARVLEEKGQGAAALELLERLVKKSPAWELPRIEAARIRMKLGQELDLALAHLEAARSIAPENPRAHFLLGLLLEERGDPLAAAASYELALSYRQDFAEARLRLAGLRFSQSQWAQAEREYRAYLKLEPAAQGAALQLAAVLEREGKLPECEEELTKLAAAQPSSTLVSRRLAEFYERTGRPELAEPLRRKLGDPPKRQLRELPRSRK